MFFIGALILAGFTILYALVSGVIIYHLQRYSIKDYFSPESAIKVFIALSVFLWISALVFLFTLPY